MFSKKKPASTSTGSTPAMRGRDGNKPSQTAANPLARRFRADGEPDTIDLTDPGRFHSPGTPAEPETREAQSAEASAVAQPLREILTVDPVTGKFYVHPASDELPVLLGGQAVTAPTELRRGDRIQVGEAEFEFLLG